MAKKGKARRAGGPAPAGTGPLAQKLRTDRPISQVYPTIDTDLARDNLENDLTEADLQDL